MTRVVVAIMMVMAMMQAAAGVDCASARASAAAMTKVQRALIVATATPEQRAEYGPCFKKRRHYKRGKRR